MNLSFNLSKSQGRLLKDQGNKANSRTILLAGYPVPEHHSPGWVPGSDLLHQLHQFLPLFTNLPMVKINVGFSIYSQRSSISRPPFAPRNTCKQLDSVSHMYAKLATHEIICSSVSLFFRLADSCYNLEKSSDIWIFAPFSSFAFLRISSYNKRK